MARGPSEIDSVQGRAVRLGADVRRQRLAAGLTQQMLADRIGYDRSYLSQVETGARSRLSNSSSNASASWQGAATCCACSGNSWRSAKHVGNKDTKRWHTAVGDQLQVERVSPPVRELKT